MAVVVQSAFALFLIISTCGTRGEAHERNAKINIYNDLFEVKKPFLLHYEQLSTNNANVTNNLMNFIRTGRNLGHSFYNEWQQIVESVSVRAAETECFKQINELVAGVANSDLTSFKYFDSWGKIPAGLLKGHTVELGNFDECVDIQKMLNAETELLGKYCFAKIPSGGLVSNAPVGDALNIDVGVCMPAVCSGPEFDIFFKLFIKSVLNLNLPAESSIINEPSCSVRAKDPFVGWDWVAIAVMITLALAMLYSSLYDYYCSWKEVKPSPILRSFSVPHNLTQLLQVQENKKNPNVIPCLNGIRSLSIIWVVFGHVFGLYLDLPMINGVDIFSWGRTPFSMFIQKGTFSVDSFFFLSGFLVAFLALRDMDRNKGKLNVPMMYLHRYLRLTPMLALAFLIYTTMYKHLSNGPMWPLFAPWKDDCRQTWWSSLLYIQNYVNVETMCYGHTWYLAVDMQLYILSPIFLIAMWRYKGKGFAFVSFIALLFVACLFTTIIVNDYSYHSNGLQMATGDTINKTYLVTHARTSPWFVGLLFGYFMHTTKNSRVKLSKFAVLLGWLLCFAMIATVFFAFYPMAQTGEETTVLEEAFFWSLARVGWGAALSWIVFASVNGYGGPIADFLSCPLWQPLARLSYCIFIWHIAVIEFHVGRVKVNKYFSNYDFTLDFWGDFGWTLLLCVVMYLAFEAPLVTLEKLLLHKPEPKPKEEIPSNAGDDKTEAVAEVKEDKSMPV